MGAWTGIWEPGRVYMALGALVGPWQYQYSPAGYYPSPTTPGTHTQPCPAGYAHAPVHHPTCAVHALYRSTKEILGVDNAQLLEHAWRLLLDHAWRLLLETVPGDCSWRLFLDCSWRLFLDCS